MTKIRYSTHHFMFTFRWDFLPKEKKVKEVNFEERTNLNEIQKLLPKNWEHKNKLNFTDYNHFTYFYKFVRDTVYDINDNNNGIVRYFEYDFKDKENKEYVISYLDDNFKLNELNKSDKKEDYIKAHTKRLTLEVNGITLFLYNTGVGVISFDLSNTKKTQSSYKDILKINEFGRRIYPQFLNFDDNQHSMIMNVQSVFLPLSIKLFDWEEDFTFYNDDAKFSSNRPLKLPIFISNLFNFNKNFVEEENDKKENDRIRIKTITDDRMFFVSWYGNKAFSKKIAQTYKNSNWWYAYIFGDKSDPSIANDEMKEQQIIAHTYPRWSNYGTLYGMSRDTFVCISSSEEYMLKENLPNLRIHQGSIYYQLAILCLVQRASVLKFSAEVTNIADLAKSKESNVTQTIENLYANYIEFRNKIYFREVTSQIQGIEIYQKFQQVMNIHNDVKDLDSEIEELNNFANLIHQRKESDETKKHTLLATIFLPAMLISGILGMNIFNSSKDIPKALLSIQANWFWWPVWLLFITTLIYINNKDKKRNSYSWMIAFWGTLIWLFIYTYFN